MSKPFVFLSYAREDKEQVDDIYRQLKAAGLNPWMDKPPDPFRREGSPVGAEWEPYVREKLREASRVLVFLSHASVAKTGFVQKEYRIALELMAERPASQQWLIPVRLDDCRPPAHRVDEVSLDQLNWYDLPRDGLQHLIDYLREALPATEEITGEHLALIHSCWRAPRHDARFGQRVYRIDVVLDAAEAVLDRVERVTYLLPPAWPTSPATTSDRQTRFGLKELTWADLLVRAKVYVRGQDVPIPLSSFIRLTKAGGRLVR
jgi:TIR domain